ncbi:periplasmic binding protein-related protein [Sulfuriferula multivorans]|uniref:Periplasmic binding protein-related protein n=1 Tax=Sulfuriferula multivorans TaxID=1559896 RepID=A0A401K118_9PROT|nr:periplasmic binding protein-related protein [Sulfuriferula multivorans]
MPLGARAATTPLTFGVFPNLSPERQFRLYQLLTDYLEQRLARPIQLYTAKTPRAFIDATQLGNFDIVLTPPHLAWLAEQEAGYRPLATYTGTINGLLVVAAASRLRSAAELRGSTIAIPDPLAIVTMLGISFLQETGLRRGTDYQFVNRGSHNNAALAVINGEVPAAIVGGLSYSQFPENMRSKLRIIGTTIKVKSFFFMANPLLPPTTVQAVREALLTFGTTPQGRLFLDHGHFGPILPATAHNLTTMARYGVEVQRLLKESTP